MDKDHFLKNLFILFEGVIMGVLNKWQVNFNKDALDTAFKSFLKDEVSHYNMEELRDKFGTPERAVKQFIEYIEA
jgi:hypothetical protein